MGTKQSEHLGGPGHTSDGAFRPAKIISKAIDFERPGGREWLPSGTPFQKFYTFFGRFFGRACLRPRYVKSLRSGFFCNVKKVCSKGHIGYAAWGLPQGPAFACTLTMSNKTKKQKLKKTQVLFGNLISNKHFGARCENTKCFSYIRILNKTCVFFSFCFFVLLDMVRVQAKAGSW